MLRFAPAYTLEMLDECDVDRLLPFYFANACPEETEDGKPTAKSGNVVERGGKKYKVVNGSAPWVDSIF